ncbi:MAG TPA: hypothetical protein VF092_06770 [Longimicrobium sp.]
MRRTLLCAAAAAVVVVACRDVTQQNPKQAAKPAAPTADASAAAKADESTVCAAYRQQLGEARTALTHSPRDASLRQNVDTYEAIISDACN